MHDRPIEADGTRFGDWEMDTIVDSYGHAIVTLTERSTNFVLLEKLKHGRKAVPTGTQWQDCFSHTGNSYTQ